MIDAKKWMPMADSWSATRKPLGSNSLGKKLFLKKFLEVARYSYIGEKLTGRAAVVFSARARVQSWFNLKHKIITVTCAEGAYEIFCVFLLEIQRNWMKIAHLWCRYAPQAKNYIVSIKNLRMVWQEWSEAEHKQNTQDRGVDFFDKLRVIALGVEKTVLCRFLKSVIWAHS